jgi:hypothetical protein
MMEADSSLSGIAAFWRQNELTVAVAVPEPNMGDMQVKCRLNSINSDRISS